jgi:hypothetical protein
VIDEETEKMILVEENAYSGLGYRAYDLRKLMGLSGKRTLHLKYYFLGSTAKSSTEFIHAKPGEYMVLDFIRFEAE